jgi:hypothetical protein
MSFDGYTTPMATGWLMATRTRNLKYFQMPQELYSNRIKVKERRWEANG